MFSCEFNNLVEDLSMEIICGCDRFYKCDISRIIDKFDIDREDLAREIRKRIIENDPDGISWSEPNLTESIDYWTKKDYGMGNNSEDLKDKTLESKSDITSLSYDEIEPYLNNKDLFLSTNENKLCIDYSPSKLYIMGVETEFSSGQQLVDYISELEQKVKKYEGYIKKYEEMTGIGFDEIP